MSTPPQLPVDIDLRGGDLARQRHLAIVRLVDEHHLAEADARDHVDGTLADVFNEWAVPIREAFEVLVERWREVVEHAVQWMRDAGVVPPLAGVADRDGDVVARVRALRAAGSGPALPRLDGRRAS